MPGPRYRDGETVTLRTIEEEDAEFCQRLVNDPRVRTRLFQNGPTNRAQELEFIESATEQGANLLVCVDGEPVGTVGYNDVNDVWDTAEIGYMIAPAEWGNGYATDALATLTADAFAERGLHKLYAHAYATNDASQRVLEKVGYSQEGLLRKEAVADGEYVDVHRYGLLADEFER
ncbi:MULTISPECIES: GNAT family N-acetyltransferase [Salinibaculum]|uniref:GNAT family N-acetyltransferase n=1 Tax=Salinibaculum TaxID=2732368 RepID=UPI0030D0D0CF